MSSICQLLLINILINTIRLPFIESSEYNLILRKKMLYYKSNNIKIQDVQVCEHFQCLPVLRQEKLVLYLDLIFYIDEVAIFSPDDNRKTNRYVSLLWHKFRSNRCERLRDRVLPVFQCKALANIVWITTTLALRAISLYGYETGFENYVGCYKMDESKMITSKVEGPFKCRDMCVSENLWYGFNDSPGYNCLCLDTLADKLPAPLENCDNLCLGRKLSYCGGQHGHVSVYSTRETSLWKMREHRKMCLFSNENCGGCERGRGAEKCDFIDCSKSNGRCGSATCRVPPSTDEVVGGRCVCATGFYMNEDFTCSDIDECQFDPCAAEISTCRNIRGSYECLCIPGYRLGINGSCLDIDECYENNNLCPSFNLTCVNILGSFYCSCAVGYELINNTCADLDECSRNQCNTVASKCVNTIGSYKCDCLAGYKPIDDFTCEDIDECVTLKFFCPVANTICHNVIGSYSCKCRQGYEMKNRSCVDLDECLEPYTCSRFNADCVNRIGTFSCVCRSGYYKDEGGVCKDIDECSIRRSCDVNSTSCENKPGDYRCICFSGFKKKPPKMPKNPCEDIDECLETDHECGKNSLCINKRGSYDCSCPLGMQLTSYPYFKECEDLDECKDDLICESSTSYCINTIGSYFCWCAYPYVNIDNYTCELGENNTSLEESTVHVEEEEEDTLGTLLLFSLLGIFGIICISYGVVLIYRKLTSEELYDTRSMRVGSMSS